jgi:hypothetical protein
MRIKPGLALKNTPLPVFIPVLWIRIRMDPKLFVGSGSIPKVSDPDPDPDQDLKLDVNINKNHKKGLIS